MREKCIEVFPVKELGQGALERAHYDWMGNGDYPWANENADSLRSFEEVFPVNIRNWEYGGCYPHVKYDLECAEEIENLKGIRLMKYMTNNYFHAVFKGKYYSLWSKKDINPHYKPNGHAPKGKLKSRYSRVMNEFTCTLTGYYIDMDLLQPVFDVMKGKYVNSDKTFADIMADCMRNWAKACSDDYDGYYSEENFIETSEANGWEYEENGRMV